MRHASTPFRTTFSADSSGFFGRIGRKPSHWNRIGHTLFVRAAPGYVIVLAAIWALGSLVGRIVAGTLPGTHRPLQRAFAAALGMGLLVPLLPPVPAEARTTADPDLAPR
ncbi:hypothetical protein [Allosalinactinospora lopnorensis]|uniref:hypothetical protein n=1 Tax=Allosalinactinospora lopnorensis TaxID=1352348 RepID=UPI000623DFEB|nr:hypothetical protein [Allosalinactinospora lopnorensis]